VNDFKWQINGKLTILKLTDIINLLSMFRKTSLCEKNITTIRHLIEYKPEL